MDVPEHLKATIDRLQALLSVRANDIIDMHASVHEDTTGTLSAVRTPGTVEREAFLIGVWAGSTAATMAFLEEGIIRPD